MKLEKPLWLARGSVIISNRHQGNGFVIQGCDFGHSRARGLLIKASNGLIESNRIERCAGVAIQIATEYEWMEGGCSRDLVVRGNVCRQNGGGILVGGNNGARKPLPADSHYDISITDNEVDGRGIVLQGCTGGEVRRNGGAKVTLRNCEGVARDERDASAPAGTLRVGSYNIRLSGDWAKGVDGENYWDFRKADLVSLVKRLDLDVFGLQEVCPDQAAYLHANLSDYCIDYIYVSDGTRLYPSDHFPVTATIRLGGE